MINVRGASVFWFEGQNWKASSSSSSACSTLLARRPVAAHGHDRTGRPARSGLWALPVALVVVVVAWLVLGLGATAPELDGRRSPAASR